eukprot:TRINITY_DN4789_c0_g1_i1.p1 TRINITY_DN4789_c0_g1~~TRINITY_DN4789_c0_g1_i1.p1  ORF type:complete len:368 (-),score=28.59 TRINITY_DN4789_c0_g1_i1:185-1138(-)
MIGSGTSFRATTELSEEDQADESDTIHAFLEKSNDSTVGGAMRSNGSKRKLIFGNASVDNTRRVDGIVTTRQGSQLSGTVEVNATQQSNAATSLVDKTSTNASTEISKVARVQIDKHLNVSGLASEQKAATSTQQSNAATSLVDKTSTNASTEISKVARVQIDKHLNVSGLASEQKAATSKTTVKLKTDLNVSGLASEQKAATSKTTVKLETDEEAGSSIHATLASSCAHPQFGRHGCRVNCSCGMFFSCYSFHEHAPDHVKNSSASEWRDVGVCELSPVAMLFMSLCLCAMMFSFCVALRIRLISNINREDYQLSS